MKEKRREFFKKLAAGSAGVALSSYGVSASAKSYNRIIGANERLNVAIAGLGRRYSAFIDPIKKKDNNANLVYLCDVMSSQMDKAEENCNKKLGYKPKKEKDIRKVLDDQDIDAIFIATPDHWHTPGTLMALKAGKHVYVEKPCSHNMFENTLIVEAQKKYNKVVQMGNQQRSAPDSQSIIKDIHDGAIGETYKATAYYTNRRGKVINPEKAAAPDGLDWDLFQGPSPRKEYMHDTWDYNWHWYGWDFGTAELGNNATHELDVARWALQLTLPLRAQVDAGKYCFKDDGWTMYDTMRASFEFENGKIIEWDGQSRNGYSTYGTGRGTIIYGSDGAVRMDRGGYEVYDRNGKEIRNSKSATSEAGIALGGGGDMSTSHVTNFFNVIRGAEKMLNSSIKEGAISQAMVHYGNLAYRAGKTLEIDPSSGHVFDRDAMALWGREYEKGWELSL